MSKPRSKKSRKPRPDAEEAEAADEAEAAEEAEATKSESAKAKHAPDVEDAKALDAAASEDSGDAPVPASPKAEVEEPPDFVEGNHETVMKIGNASMPPYIAAAWLTLFIGYAVYWYTYGLPDFRAWGAP